MTFKPRTIVEDTKIMWLQDSIAWDTWALVEESHHHFNFIPDLNITFLTFISKEDKVKILNNFFLTSLYNMVYRIITKVIYVEGRKILDWVILSTW